MINFEEDETHHKKKSMKKPPKKSKHKHDYEMVEKENRVIKSWFNYKYVCKICGKVYTEFRIEK